MTKNKKQSKEDKNQVIRDRILVARNYTREWHNRVKQWNKYWNGSAKPASIRPVDYIFVNYIYAIIKNKISRLYYRNPFINVKPVNPQDAKAVIAAEQAEPILNKQMHDRKLGIRGQIKKSLLDWQRWAIGAFWVGWSTDLEQEDEEVKSILEDQPDFRRLHPLKIHFPPSWTPEKIPYIVIEIDVSLEDLKKRDGYDQSIIENLASASISYIKTEGQQSKESKDLARIKTFHYYDSKERAVYVQSEDRPILAPEANPYAEIFSKGREIPVRFIFGEDDIESDWPIGTIQLMEKLQLELNKTRTQKATHRKRFNRKYIADKSILTSDDLSKLEEGQDGTIVPVNIEGGKQINNLVWPVPDAQQTPANDEMDRLIKDDINVITGSSQVGLSGRSVNPTATQDQIGEARSQSREDEEQELVEEFVEEIYTALLQLDQAKLQTPLAVKINGAGKQEWKDVTSEEIKGELVVSVVSGSMVRETDDQIRKEAAAISAQLQTSPNFGKLQPEVTVAILDSYPQFSNIAEKAKEILKQEEQNPPAPPLPPPSTAAQILVAISDLVKSGVQVSIPQIEAALIMAGLPPSRPATSSISPNPPQSLQIPSEGSTLPSQTQMYA